MGRILLNKFKQENYCFFDELHYTCLTLSNPMGYVKEISPNLERAIEAGNVIDLDDSFKVDLDKLTKLRVLRTLEILGLSVPLNTPSEDTEGTEPEPEEDQDVEEAGPGVDEPEAIPEVAKTEATQKKKSSRGKASTKKGDVK